MNRIISVLVTIVIYVLMAIVALFAAAFGFGLIKGIFFNNKKK